MKRINKLRYAKAKRFALCFVPSGKEYRKFSGIISQLSKEHHAPKFEPHVTILPQINIPKNETIQKARAFGLKLSPFHIKIGSLSYGNKYFYCVFAKVKKSKEIIGAYQMAKRMFNHGNSDYSPHLSIMYGNFSPKLKKIIIKKMGKFPKSGFKVKSISIFDVNGPVKNWKIIKEIKMK